MPLFATDCTRSQACIHGDFGGAGSGTGLVSPTIGEKNARSRHPVFCRPAATPETVQRIR